MDGDGEIGDAHGEERGDVLAIAVGSGGDGVEPFEEGAEEALGGAGRGFVGARGDGVVEGDGEVVQVGGTDGVVEVDEGQGVVVVDEDVPGVRVGVHEADVREAGRERIGVGKEAHDGVLHGVVVRVGGGRLVEHVDVPPVGTGRSWGRPVTRVGVELPEERAEFSGVIVVPRVVAAVFAWALSVRDGGGGVRSLDVEGFGPPAREGGDGLGDGEVTFTKGEEPIDFGLDLVLASVVDVDDLEDDLPVSGGGLQDLAFERAETLERIGMQAVEGRCAPGEGTRGWGGHARSIRGSGGRLARSFLAPPLARLGGVSMPRNVQDVESAVKGGAPQDVDRLARFLERGRVMVLSGAGVSTASGIPDYRGPNATPREPMRYQTFLSGVEAQRRYWARSSVGWPVTARAEPNPTHHGVAQLERCGVVQDVLTQNVDGLHQRAGSQRVLELHGSLATVVCLTCGARSARSRLQDRIAEANPGFAAEVRLDDVAPDGDVEIPDAWTASFVVPPCEACGGALKPDVVFFGENVPRERVERGWSMVESADALLVLGSSLTVFSGYRFVRRAKELGKPVAIVNRGVTRGDGEASLKIDGALEPLLSESVRLVRGA